jgi:hypothetical protein
MPGNLFDGRQLVDRLGVVGDRAVAIDGDRHRAHAEEAEGDQAEGEHGGHDAGLGGSGLITATRSPCDTGRRRSSGDDDEAHPEGGEVAGDQAGQDVEAGAAFTRRGDDFATWRELVEVKTLTTSGMIAPASVPKVMITTAATTDWRRPPPIVMLPISRLETMKVSDQRDDRRDQTSEVSGASKLK